jgi:hypothetical protein
MSHTKCGRDPAPPQNGVLQAAMRGMRRVVRGRSEGSSGQAVTNLFDSCRDAITAAGPTVLRHPVTEGAVDVEGQDVRMIMRVCIAYR